MAVAEWLAVATWLMGPCLFVAGCWGVVGYPEVVALIFPWPLFKGERGERERVSPSTSDGISSTLLRREKVPLLEKELKAVPKNWFLAFLVGRAAGRIEAPDSSENTILVEAADIVGISVDDSNKETLVNLGDIIEIVEQRKTKIQAGNWLSQFFSIVNICWFIGIMGVLCLLSLSLIAFRGPFMHWLADVAVSIYHLLSQLEPLWPLCFWLLCVYLAAISLSLPPFSAQLVVVLAMVLSVGGYIYRISSVPNISFNWQVGFLCIYLSLAMGPLAYKFDSIPLGVATLFIIYQAFVILMASNFYIFFDQHFFRFDGVICLSSFIFTILLPILKFRLEDRFFRPFRFGLYYFGPMSFFGNFLSISSYRVGITTLGQYVTTNVLFIASVLTMFVFGTLVDFKAFRNTSILCTLFWVFYRMCDVTLLFGEHHYAIQVCLFLLSNVLAAVYAPSNLQWAKDLIP